MAADGDHVFPSEAVQLSAMEYPTSRFALFHDTHIFGVEDNQQYYRDVRRTFFEHGLHSPEFDTVMSDGRQLNGKRVEHMMAALNDRWHGLESALFSTPSMKSHVS